MTRLLLTSVLLGSLVAPALAQPKAKVAPPAAATLPAVGETTTINGNGWANKEWLYDVPSEKDAAGKILVHWFCGPKVKTCADDLARILTLREGGRVYVIAHIAGSKAQAKKLDPIRLSEGVGHGTVGYGAATTKLMRQMAVTQGSVVVDVDGKVALVTTGSTPAELDARDKKVTDLAAAIKNYVATVSDSPKSVKPGEKFQLSIKIQLANWLTFAKAAPMELKMTVPPDFKCDAKVLTGDQIKIDGSSLTAAVTCSAPKGIYEARGDLRFGYATGTGGDGIGAEGGRWKFEVKP